jgi:hypothetical protein
MVTTEGMTALATGPTGHELTAADDDPAGAPADDEDDVAPELDDPEDLTMTPPMTPPTTSAMTTAAQGSHRGSLRAGLSLLKDAPAKSRVFVPP